MGGTSGRGKDQTDDQLPEDSHASGAVSGTSIVHMYSYLDVKSAEDMH